MNFYPPVLRHTGTFSTVWLVATKGRKVTRREILGVTVKTTCDDIMDYVLGRVPPPEPGLPRPRFSLYLSSQLQYGVVLVFHRQCALLLADLHSFMVRMTKMNVLQMIDLGTTKRSAVDLRDTLPAVEDLQGAAEPLFGLMAADALGPDALVQISQNFLPGSPRPDAASPETSFTSPKEDITMREDEPAALPAHQFEGEDLAISDAMVDLLMGAEDVFTEEAEVLRREETAALEDRERTEEMTPATIQSSRETLMLTDELDLPGTTTPQEPRTSPPGLLTPTAEPLAPHSPAEPAAARRREAEDPAGEEEVRTMRTRRRRQLVFWDPVTQLAHSIMKQWMDDLHSHTRRPLLPSSRLLTAAQLLGNPCTELPEPLMEQWRQAQKVTPLADLELQIGKRGAESSESDRAGPEADLLQDSDQREVLLETETESLAPGVSVSIPEELEQVPEEPAATEAAAAAAEAPVSLPEEVEEIIFASLLPPQCSRRNVSHVFSQLLKNVSAGKLHVRQDEPYGHITILSQGR